MSQPEEAGFRLVSGDEAARHMDELTTLCREVYAEPPYEWGTEHEKIFLDSFARQCRAEGFGLVEARCGGDLIAFGFGVPLPPTTSWWQQLLTPVSDDITREHVGRTFALIELLVHRLWRRKHVAETIHDRLIQSRYEERATLTAMPAATTAQAAYAKWGWHKIAQKRNPLPGSPIFDILIKELKATGAA